jgi:hypothetical protein
VRPGTCVVQRRKLRRSMARRHCSSQWGEHACSGSVARRHGESGRSCGCISKEDGSKDFIEVYPKLLHIPLSNQPCFVSLCSYILALFHRTCPTRRVLVRSIVLSVTGIEPTVDRQKSRWSIPIGEDRRDGDARAHARGAGAGPADEHQGPGRAHCAQHRPRPQGAQRGGVRHLGPHGAHHHVHDC